MTNERVIDKKVLLIVNPKAGRAKLKSKADGTPPSWPGSWAATMIWWSAAAATAR